MDLRNTTAEDLVAALPPTEDDRWELKSASLLEPSSKGELKKELGKQVSAFANSGGGTIVFGIADATHSIESCANRVGRQPMEDFMATMVEQSVEYPVRCFQVHRISLRDDPSSAIFAIHIEDSPAAPHQAKDERQYYYRISGHSKPAPHFHLELLRSRQAKCIVEPHVESVQAKMPLFSTKGSTFSLSVTIAVENHASFVAQPVGISIFARLPGDHWTLKSGKDELPQRHVLNEVHLFPGLTTLFPMELVCKASELGELGAMASSDLDSVNLEIRAFSQNYGSGPITFVAAEHISRCSIQQMADANAIDRAQMEERAREQMENQLPQLKAQLDATGNEVRRLLRPPSIQFPDAGED